MASRPDGAWRQALGRAYERASGLAMRHYPITGLRGTAASWQQQELVRSLALVVELPAGRLGADAVTSQMNLTLDVLRGHATPAAKRRKPTSGTRARNAPLTSPNGTTR